MYQVVSKYAYSISNASVRFSSVETAFSFLKRNVRSDLMGLDLKVLDSMKGSEFRELVINSSKCLTKKVALSILRANHSDLAMTL